MTVFQCVLRDGATLLRPYPPALTQDEAFYDYAKAAREFPGAEPLIIYGESVAHLERILAGFRQGFPVNWLKPNEQGMRLALEFQPLREEYPTGTTRSVLESGFTRDQLRALIRLMGRVNAGALGGEDDGNDEGGAAGGEHIRRGGADRAGGEADADGGAAS